MLKYISLLSASVIALSASTATAQMGVDQQTLQEQIRENNSTAISDTPIIDLGEVATPSDVSIREDADLRPLQIEVNRNKIALVYGRDGNTFGSFEKIGEMFPTTALSAEIVGPLVASGEASILGGSYGVVMSLNTPDAYSEDIQSAIVSFVEAGGTFVFTPQSNGRGSDANVALLSCFGVSMSSIEINQADIHPWLPEGWQQGNLTSESGISLGEPFSTAGELRATGATFKTALRLDLDQPQTGCEGNAATISESNIIIEGTSGVGFGVRVSAGEGQFVALSDWHIFQIVAHDSSTRGLEVFPATYQGGLLADANCPIAFSILGVADEIASSACLFDAPEVRGVHYYGSTFQRLSGNVPIELESSSWNGLVRAWISFQDEIPDVINFSTGVGIADVFISQTASNALPGGPSSLSIEQLRLSPNYCARDRFGQESCAPLLNLGARMDFSGFGPRVLTAGPTQGNTTGFKKPTSKFAIEALEVETIDNSLRTTSYTERLSTVYALYDNNLALNLASPGEGNCTIESGSTLGLPKAFASSKAGVTPISFVSSGELTALLEVNRGAGETVVFRFDKLSLSPEGLDYIGNRAVSGVYKLNIDNTSFPVSAWHIGYYSDVSEVFRPVLSSTSGDVRVNYNFFDPDSCIGQFITAESETPMRFTSSIEGGNVASTQRLRASFDAAFQEVFPQGELNVSWKEIGSILTEPPLPLTRVDVFGEGAHGDRRVVGEIIDPGILEEHFVLYSPSTN